MSDEYGYEMSDELKEAIEEAPALERREDGKLGEAIEAIANGVNGWSAERVSKVLVAAICRQHRTLQAQSIKAFLEMFKLYAGSPYDLRNKAAVEAAQRITELDLYIPFI